MREHPLKAWRLKAGLLQSEMAEKIGIDQARLSRFETGDVKRLEPEQAFAAAELSKGAIGVEDCLKKTPWALRRKAAARRPRKSKPAAGSATTNRTAD